MVRGPWGADNQMGIKRKMNDMTKKPEGLKAFDDLCRKLVKVSPAKTNLSAAHIDHLNEVFGFPPLKAKQKSV